jgi:hypothetical protein
VAWKNMQAYAGPSFDHGSWWKKIIYYSDPIWYLYYSSIIWI